jgi:hypothetical protein
MRLYRARVLAAAGVAIGAPVTLRFALGVLDFFVLHGLIPRRA